MSSRYELAIELEDLVPLIRPADSPEKPLIYCVRKLKNNDKTYYYLRANAVVCVKHTCDTVKTKTIKLVFFHPKPQVA